MHAETKPKYGSTYHQTFSPPSNCADFGCNLFTGSFQCVLLKVLKTTMDIICFQVPITLKEQPEKNTESPLQISY